MIPGNPQFLTCPYCGEKKKVLSLISGNTFDAKLWSDNKQIAPMLPEVSCVQKCPKCGKYFFIYKQEAIYADNGYSSDCGTLTFPETIEAYQQFTRDNEIENEKDEVNIRFMLFQAFNDYYYRDDKNEKKVVDSYHHQLFVETGKWIINHVIKDKLMEAEFYRQIGKLDKAKEIASMLSYDDDFRKNLLKQVKERIEFGDCKVFQIY